MSVIFTKFLKNAAEIEKAPGEVCVELLLIKSEESHIMCNKSSTKKRKLKNNPRRVLSTRVGRSLWFESYTGHVFQRTSTTLLLNKGPTLWI